MSHEPVDGSDTTLVMSDEAPVRVVGTNLSGSPRLAPGPKPKGVTRPCATCGEPKNDGRTECGKCRAARYRRDPERAERQRASARAYKERQRAFAEQMKRTGR